jgi:serine/threonine protein kinase
MEKAFSVELISYASLLKIEKVAFREDDMYLSVGQRNVKTGWVLFISCRTLDTVNILKKILEPLKKNKIVFRMIKNQLLQYALNAGAYGNTEVGKVISIFPETQTEAVEIASELCKLTNSYKGPVIPGALRLGSLIFTQYNFETFESNTTSIRSSPEVSKKPPFFVPKCYSVSRKRKLMIGKYYIPVELIASSPKGDIFKAINLKKLAFNWCLIKEGKSAALDDHFNREMKDRLLWQKEVLETICGEVQTPKVIDYFERDGSSFLVIEYIEGENLGKIIFDRLNGTTWREMENQVKIQLLVWYQEALDIVNEIHKKGFVHRDITDSNFLVLTDGSVCIIDFELSFNLESKLPNPPFVLGSYGYAAPEQLNYAIPHQKEDVYSMGALLCYLLSGLQPINFINTNPNVTTAKLHRLTGNAELTKLVSRCLHLQRKSRPELHTLKEGIQKYLLTIK